MKKSLLAIITLSMLLGACGKNIDIGNAATDVAVVEDTVSEDITLAAKTGEDKADEALSNVRELEKGAHTDDKPDVAPAIEDMDPLYKKFLKGEMVASTKYADWPMVSINDYKEDAIMWYVENAGMRYCLLDVNSDGNDELVMYTGFDGTFKMYVISSDGNELNCYDFFDIKTRQDRFNLYDNGVFSFEETLSENEERYFTYDENGEKNS